ncbi:type II toxin-antitoxin system VapC family toxin [candidate division CSSED10-310 bacterium]|uniref:Type II toxin-antitoxin system VapC family toxin n=1 Tax=candidate division CSSED10-310 bacterium TaxID=2855610 RepID=A0ABV6YRC2_UNCC1
MYLFDTDTLSNIVKRKPSPKLLKKLQTLPYKLQFTSAINIGEIYYGAERTDRRDLIIEKFESFVFPNVQVLSFDHTSAKTYGKIRAILEKRGSVCSEPDLRIASIAIQHKLILISGNIKHFKKIPGLKIDNWIE